MGPDLKQKRLEIKCYFIGKGYLGCVMSSIIILIRRTASDKKHARKIVLAISKWKMSFHDVVLVVVLVLVLVVILFILVAALFEHQINGINKKYWQVFIKKIKNVFLFVVLSSMFDIFDVVFRNSDVQYPISDVLLKHSSYFCYQIKIAITNLTHIYLKSYIVNVENCCWSNK